MRTPPTHPKLSATVLLIREAPDLQVLMVRRHSEIEFAGGALVFPGGKTDPDDDNPDWHAHTDGDYSGSDQILRIAAVREAFEEAGILLARPATQCGIGEPLIDGQTAAALSPLRDPIERGEVSFMETIRDEGLVLALDTLIHFGHWVTPEMMPKRFDTHFYLAPTPEGQVALQDGRETTEAIWLEPQAALDLEAANQADIIFPTRMNLGKLAEADSVAQAIKRFSREPVISVTPQIGKNTLGQPCLNIPAEAGYIQTTELIQKVIKGVGQRPQ